MRQNMNSRKLMFRADSVQSMSGLASIEAAVAGNNQVISALLADDPMAGGSVPFESEKKVERDLKKCSESV